MLSKFESLKATFKDFYVLEAIHNVALKSVDSIRAREVNSFAFDWSRPIGVIKKEQLWKDDAPSFLKWVDLDCREAIRTVAFAVSHCYSDSKSVIQDMNGIYAYGQIPLIVQHNKVCINQINQYFDRIDPFSDSERRFGSQFITAVLSQLSWLFDGTGFVSGVSYTMPGLMLLPNESYLKALIRILDVWKYLTPELVHGILMAVIGTVIGLWDLYYTLALPEVQHPTYYSVCMFSDFCNKPSVMFGNDLVDWSVLLNGMEIDRRRDL